MPPLGSSEEVQLAISYLESYQWYSVLLHCWSTMTSSYPPDWDEIRKRVYRRDNYTCQNCGATNTELHAHHKTPISMGGSHKLSNLTTICQSCHSDIHGYQIGGNQENVGGFFVWGTGAVIFIVLSFSIPPMAILTVPLAILCIIFYLLGY